ncbi:hypothetical protein PanWU01x14_085490, partial [Parasponia andersonii]
FLFQVLMNESVIPHIETTRIRSITRTRTRPCSITTRRHVIIHFDKRKLSLRISSGRIRSHPKTVTTIVTTTGVSAIVHHRRRRSNILHQALKKRRVVLNTVTTVITVSVKLMMISLLLVQLELGLDVILGNQRRVLMVVMMMMMISVMMRHVVLEGKMRHIDQAGGLRRL